VRHGANAREALTAALGCPPATFWYGTAPNREPGGFLTLSGDSGANADPALGMLQ